MRKILPMILIVSLLLSAQALFEVKDSSDHSVFEITNDGIRIFNFPDTLMIISSAEIRANLDNTGKGLSRSFSVSTNATGKGALANVLEVGTQSTIMREGVSGEEYTDFSPLNLFLGLNAGQNTIPNPNPFNGGDQTTWEGKFNIFVGNEAGRDNVGGYFNLFIGDKAGQSNTDGQKNTFVGSQSGQVNQSGGYNAYFGYNSGITSTGSGNVFFGANCGFNNESSAYNTYLGYAAGEYFQGSGNTFIGNQVGRNAWNLSTGSGNVFIGNYVGSESGSVSDRLYIDNSNTNTPLIYGEFDNNLLAFNTNKTYVKHPTGTANGLYIQSTYNGNTDTWHLYQYSSKELALFYNGSKRGDFDITSGAYTSVSDKRFKKNIEEFTSVLNRVMLLQPKRYNFISQSNDEQKYVGLLAQDVKELFPSFVHYTKEDDVYTMDYAGLSVVAIQAIKEQQKEINDLKSEIEEIKRFLSK